MSNYVVVGFLTLLLQVQRCKLLFLPPDGVLNNAAVRVTCSGHELLASKLVVAKQLHPLQGSLILKLQCAGGADAYKPVIPVGKVTNIYYGGDPTSRCLFKKGTAYTLAIQVVAFGTTVVGKVTVSCPLKLVFSQLNRDPYPPYQLKYKSGPMPASIVSIKCNYDSSVDLTFLPQKRKKIILVSCLKVKFTYTVEASSVAMRAALDADPFMNCVFRDDIPSVRDGASKWKRAAKTIKGIEVSLFDYATLASEGTGVVVPCKPPPPTTTTTPAPTTEKFTTQKWTTQQWTTEGFTTEPTPEVTTPGPTTTENFPTEPSTTPTTRPTTPKATTSKPTAPKATTPKPTTPKATTPKPSTPKATTPKPTTPKATTPKPTTPKATTPKPTTPKATTPKPTTPKATTPKPTTPKATTPKPTTPKATTPKPTTPKATTPKPTTTKATTPKPTTPKATTPKPTTPKATTPKPTTPKATTPKPTTPKATTPKPTTPKATTPKPTTPKATTPKPTTPKPTAPKPTTPKATTPKATTPKPTTPKATTPKPTTPKPTTPKPTTPKATTPKATTPKPTTPKATTPKPTTPKATTPKPTTPKATTQKPTPKATTPKPTTPKATTPKPTTPKATTPKPTTPKATTPKPTTPKATTPKPTTPKPTTPKATTPKPTTPKATTPKPTTPKPTTPKPTTPKATTPKATTPKPTTPKATTPKPTTPKATTPKPTTPKATTPKATTPKPTTPKATTPKPTTPKPTTPKPTTPKPTTPKPTTPKATTPKATTPKPTTPKATTPKPTTPKATTPKPTTPKATTPKATTPKPTTPKATTQKPTTPKPTTPKPTTPKATTPKATTPKPTTPKATTPKPTTPKATTPKPTTPKATTPKPTTPEATTQKPTPKATTPKPTTPKATPPKPTTPKATTPKPTTPKATTPPSAPPGFTLNKAATWITCSGKTFVPSTIDFSEKLHPLHKFLVLRPSCGGGSDIRALPARLKVYHTGTAKKCLFLVKGSSYTIQVDVLAYGARSIGRLDFSCPIPLAPTSPPPSIFPPYPLRIISNLIQVVDIDCSQNDSITANLLPQRSRVVVALKCQDSTKTFVVKNTPVAVTVWKKGADTQSKCVFRNDHGIQPGSGVPRLNVPVVFFKWADFSYLGTGSIEPCNENPSKYILDVSSHCGRSTSDATWVTGISDVDAEFQAVCKSGKVFKFNNVNGDRVNYSLPLYFTGNAASKCIFNRRENSQVYVITVKASWGEGSNLIHQSNREYQVTCVYGSRGSDDTQVQSISDRLIAAKSMQENKGPDSKLIIRLDIVDVLGVPVTFMPQGRKVKLRAVGRGQGREVGLKTIGCDAIGTTSNARYAVIRGGCGDGLIFKKTEGLTTRGLTATSPYFKVFAMRNDNLLKFECNFTMCASNCDGSSCSNGRRRRGIWEDDFQIQQAHSRIIRVL